MYVYLLLWKIKWVRILLFERPPFSEILSTRAQLFCPEEHTHQYQRSENPGIFTISSNINAFSANEWRVWVHDSL